MVGWSATMPSANRRRRLSIGNLRCNVRNGGVMVSGLSLTLSMAWHCAHEGQAALRRRRLGQDGAACQCKKGAQRDDEPWDAAERFLYHLIRRGFSISLGRQCQERGRIGAVFLPSRIGGVVCERVLAAPFASADRAHPLKIPHDLRLSLRDFLPVELDLVHPPIQQIRGVRPFAGEDGEIGSANTDVAGDAFHLGRTATIEVRHRPASAVPASPPMREPTNKAGPFTCLSRAGHSGLHDEGHSPMR